MNDCLFCKIIAGEIPSTKVYEDELENSGAVAKIFEAIPKIAAAEGLTNGYRVLNCCGEDGGQTVFHLHFHILGGKKLSESF